MSTVISTRHRIPVWTALAALVLVASTLGGCGKKATVLDPPEGSGPEAKLYPRIYPNPKYDPKPPSAQAPAHAKPTPALQEPPESREVYPRIIRPENMTPTSALALPTQGNTGRSAWPDARNPQ